MKQIPQRPMALSTGKAIALAEIPEFFVACERVADPSLVSRPLVVLAPDADEVRTCSHEALALGILPGTPLFKIGALVEAHQIAVLPSNDALYDELSQRVWDTLAHYTPHLEAHGPEAAFLDLDGLTGQDLHQYGQTLQTTVGKWLNLPLSVGIAETQTLAKVANRIARRSKKAQGVLALLQPHHVEAALQRTPIQDVWGVSTRIADFLQRHSIETGAAFRHASPDWVKQHLRTPGLRLWKELWGFRCNTPGRAASAAQSISATRGFRPPLSDAKLVTEAVAALTTRAARKLQQRRSVAGMVSVLLTTPATHHASASHTLTLALPQATQSPAQLAQFTSEALSRWLRSDREAPAPPYLKAGVLLLDVRPESPTQYNLFEATDEGHQQRQFRKMIDQVHQKMGHDFVQQVAQRARQETADAPTAPQATLSWDDLLNVH
ncbi:hypothetical protein [Catalinimonas alkaloidigena]|nr:hypothetical protein [Catalinimonas alkaloidigena]